jgi:hypothetical protein
MLDTDVGGARPAGAGAARPGRGQRWRLGAAVLVAAAAAVFGATVAGGPPAQETEATAVLRTPVRPGEAARLVRSTDVVDGVAAATGVDPGAVRDGLELAAANGFRLALRYPGASARSGTIATEAVRRVGSVLLDDALTRADRALVAAERAGEDVRGAERAAQAAREARDAAFDVRVATATVRPGGWTLGMATVAALLLGAVAACVVAARSRGDEPAHGATRPAVPAAPSAPRPPAPPVRPALTLAEIERELARLEARRTRDRRQERADDTVPV